MEKHPGAFLVDFGDVDWFLMEIEKVRFLGGFDRVGSATPEDYANAKPDPISAFGMHIAQHMNEDRQSATITMIAEQIPGLDVSEAILSLVDTLSMYRKVTGLPRARDRPQQFKLTLQLIVRM